MTETEQMMLYYQQQAKYPPCYDRQTGEHCDKRYPGCHAKCKEWAVYQAVKESEYERRKFAYETNQILSDAIQRMKKPRHKKCWHSGENYKKQ